MIPKKVLIETIEQFDTKFNELNKQLDEINEPNELHLKYFNMVQAWNEFQNAVEQHLLPFTDQPQS